MRVNCPKCKSDKITTSGASYPNSYECDDCGHMFLKAPNALIDE